MAPLEIPPTFLAYAERGPAFADWLMTLRALVGEVVEDWQLAYDGPPVHGHAALVVPVRTSSGRPAVLKVGFPHPEAEHEHLALQAWHGNGAVQLLRADPRRSALLLERLYVDEDLNSLGDLLACEIIAGFYRRLHLPALPQLTTLSSYISRWTEQLTRLPRSAPLPRRLVEQAVALGGDLCTDSGADEVAGAVMIHGDLHYANVLAADREPWLVIDPKPMAGDPHYEIAPLLWNRWDDIVASGAVRDGVRRRFHTVVDTAELDEERARDWVIVRMTHNALWTIQDAVAAGSVIGLEDQNWITRCVAIAKAVQD